MHIVATQKMRLWRGSGGGGRRLVGPLHGYVMGRSSPHPMRGNVRQFQSILKGSTSQGEVFFRLTLTLLAGVGAYGLTQTAVTTMNSEVRVFWRVWEMFGTHPRLRGDNVIVLSSDRFQNCHLIRVLSCFLFFFLLSCSLSLSSSDDRYQRFRYRN